MNARKRLATKGLILFSSMFVILKMKSMKTMASSTNKPLERNIIAVGKTGAGKSKLLNALQDAKKFESSADGPSCTDKITQNLATINLKFGTEKSDEIISIELNAYDTPGIADSEGRSERFLNDIAEKIKTTPLNLLIIVVEYGRHDTSFYNNLEILRECLNGLSQSSSMLIVNKVPTERVLARVSEREERKRAIERPSWRTCSN